jgi:hypothetical protein
VNIYHIVAVIAITAGCSSTVTSECDGTFSDATTNCTIEGNEVNGSRPDDRVLCNTDDECPTDTDCTNWICASTKGAHEHAQDDVKVCVAFPLGGPACGD